MSRPPPRPAGHPWTQPRSEAQRSPGWTRLSGTSQGGVLFHRLPSDRATLRSGRPLPCRRGTGGRCTHMAPPTRLPQKCKAPMSPFTLSPLKHTHQTQAVQDQASASCFRAVSSHAADRLPARPQRSAEDSRAPWKPRNSVMTQWVTVTCH